MLVQTGCVTTSNQQPQMTEEQRQQAEAARQQFIARMMAATSQYQSSSQQTAPVQETKLDEVSSVELLERLNEITSTGFSALFSVQRDGVQINEQMYLDPMGNIENAGWNNATGHFTYLVSNPAGDLTLKFFRAGSQSTPLAFATATPKRNGYHIRTADGQVVAGQSIIPTSDGFIVARENSLFRYQIGKSVASLSIPRGWTIARLQRGDVDATGLILLEKSDELSESQNRGIRGLLSGLPGTGAVTDYALFDLSSQKSFLLNMSKNQKTVSELSDCRRQNSLVNKCSTLHSYESLYEPNGRKNRLHYYWALDWFNTSIGPMATYNSGTRVFVVDVSNAQKITLFSRVLGVNNFDINRLRDGTITLDAQLGLSREHIDDLVQHLSSNTFEIESASSI